MKIKTVKNTIAFLVVTFSLASATSAYAYVPGVWDPQPRIQDNTPGFYVVPNTPEPLPVPQTVPTVAYNNQTTNNTTNNTVNNTTTNSTRNTRNVPAARVRSTESFDNSSAPELKPVVTDNTNNGLTALSVAGSGGFMPSSIWQWFLVVLLILAIIILARILSRSDHHEIHTVTAH